jgi:hypothetical protein
MLQNVGTYKQQPTICNRRVHNRKHHPVPRLGLRQIRNRNVTNALIEIMKPEKGEESDDAMGSRADAFAASSQNGNQSAGTAPARA